MGMIKAGGAVPAIPEDHVRFYVDVDVKEIKERSQEELNRRVGSIDANDRNRDAKIAIAAEEIRKQYTDKIMAVAVGQFQQEREIIGRRMNNQDLDKQIEEKQKEIARIQAEKALTFDDAEEVASEISPD